MKFEPIQIDQFENLTTGPAYPHPTMQIGVGARVINSKILGPLYLNRNSQLGPNAVVGKYFELNDSCYVARAEIGAYCTFGARTAINPFNHPTDWLSIHEFQYHPNSFHWVDEYRSLSRLERTGDMFDPVKIGNDVWMGHNVNILPGVTIGTGAVIGAGAVVTKDVPPYAVVVGVPAAVKRYRFGDKTIERLLASEWWDLELSDLSGIPFRDVERSLDMIEELKSRPVK